MTLIRLITAITQLRRTHHHKKSRKIENGIQFNSNTSK